ncbi:MAG: hypothetical protein KF693_15490 [Nitrospira sp.]|nr:hypothetical protein [Nitrospira sp.]
MPIQALTEVDPHRFLDLRSTSDRGAYRLETGVRGVAVSNDFSGRLSVRTAEGDTITLAANLEVDFRAGRYHAHGGSRQAAVSIGAEYVQYGLQREFSIAVDGDLNVQERSDLRKLLQKISGIFRGFVEGRDEKALAQAVTLAERFHGLATLSSLDLSVEVVRSVTVAAASAYTPGGAPVTAAAIPLLSNGTTAPTPSGDPSEDGGLSALRQDTSLVSLIQRVFDALKEAETELQKFQKYLPDFFEKLHEDLLKSLEDVAKPKEEAQARPVEQTPSTIANDTVSTAYSSVDIATLSLSVQG